MKVRNSSKAALTLGVSILLCVAPVPLPADVGGGKGYPATPWRMSAPRSVQDIEKAKAVAAQYQTLSMTTAAPSGDDSDVLRLRRVSLRVEPPRADDGVGYALVGKSASGETVSLLFSEIESFVVTSRKAATLSLSVTVWPDISPQQLLDRQPTYQQLVAGYRRTVALEVSMRSADGRPLVFAEKGEFGATLPLEKLTAGTPGNFYGEHPHMTHPLRFWWAIPSVSKDPEYPYRMIPAASRGNEPLAAVVVKLADR
jgi:hypothetical protein